MRHFAVSFAKQQSRDYAPIQRRLESMGAVALLDAVWLVLRSSTAIHLRDELQATLHQEDALAVVELAPCGLWATRHAVDAGLSYLKRNMS